MRQSPDVMRSMEMLAYLRLLYDVEREAGHRNLRGEEHLEREQPKVLPKSPEGQAVAYTLSNWKALIRYCEDADFDIDNNGAEKSFHDGFEAVRDRDRVGRAPAGRWLS